MKKIPLSNVIDITKDKLHYRDDNGNVVDIESKHVRKRHMMLEGFKVQEIELLYKGICQECQNEKAS